MELAQENKIGNLYGVVTGAPVPPPTYWLTRFLILRLLGAIYAVAFLVAINQIVPLIGANGLLPVGIYLDRIGDALGSRGAGFERLPSLFWLFHSDGSLLTVAWIGFLLSCVVLAGYANALVLAVLWFLYMSFVHVGQDWYGYGWEIQLLETGFLAIFLCPLVDMRPFPRRAPPVPVIVLFRWLIFRIMLGSGMIKIRGDDVWRNGTALYLPFRDPAHARSAEPMVSFFAPYDFEGGRLVQFPGRARCPMVCILAPGRSSYRGICDRDLTDHSPILSGNLSFLNWLTILPALACFDDGFWSRLLPRPLVRRAQAAISRAEPSRPMHDHRLGHRCSDCNSQHPARVQYAVSQANHEHLLRSPRIS